MPARSIITLVLAAMLFGSESPLAATTELVSVALGGGGGDGPATTATLTPDGRVVVFASSASDLVADDTNVFCDIDQDEDDDNCPDIFVRDRASSTTTLVSKDSSGVQANQLSDNPDVSADGRWVVFESLASNLVPGDTNDQLDCFIHDRSAGQTERVSITTDEGQASGTSCRVSDDGQVVLFASYSNALTPFGEDSYQDIFIRDRQAGTTRWISPGLAIFPGDNECDLGTNLNGSISGDGRYAIFTHDDMEDCDEGYRVRTVFIFDREATTWQRMPVSISNLFNAGPLDFARFFTYRLYNGDDFLSLYVRDRELNKTEEVGVRSDGSRASGHSFGGRVTADGRIVAFSSNAPDLVPGDTNVCNVTASCDDVFLRDRDAKTTERVSLGANGEEGDGNSQALGVGDGGGVVLFRSEATNLVPSDGNGVQDIFVRVSLCGDDTVDRGEECDDGNVVGGDGCSATCLLDCPPTPRGGCLSPVQSGKATIKLMDRAPVTTKNQLQWKWPMGAPTAKSAFGSPTTSDGYRLCVYDGSGLALSAGIPPGSAWKEGSTGFKYKSKSALPDGITSVMLKEGVAGKAKIQVKGKGAALPMPMAGLGMLATALTVQLSSSDAVATCWEAVYSEPFQSQSATLLTDKAD
ncbi:MAG: hypothetical protein IT293_06465 [Deltaproteobacteria bacterium]|nr:hypothetical protein [Deltaproteobacteria bacterium]